MITGWYIPMHKELIAYIKNVARKSEQLRVQRHREMTAPIMNSVKEDRIELDSMASSYHRNRLQTKWLWVMVIIVATLSGALFGSFLTTAIRMQIQRRTNNELYDDHTSVFTDTTGAIKYISRNDWTAQPPEEDPIPLKLPSTRVIIAHTATKNCTNLAACKLLVRSIQTHHIETLKWDDISYNFLIGGNGDVFVGRGWNVESRLTKGYNKRSISIAFIGTFTNQAPPPQQLRAAQELIDEGVVIKKLSENYKVYGHRQLKATESPGEKLYEIIKTWAHWTAEIE